MDRVLALSLGHIPPWILAELALIATLICVGFVPPMKWWTRTWIQKKALQERMRIHYPWRRWRCPRTVRIMLVGPFEWAWGETAVHRIVTGGWFSFHFIFEILALLGGFSMMFGPLTGLRLRTAFRVRRRRREPWRGYWDPPA